MNSKIILKILYTLNLNQNWTIGDKILFYILHFFLRLTNHLYSDRKNTGIPLISLYNKIYQVIVKVYFLKPS